MEPWRYLSDEDKEAYEYAARRKIVIPRYRASGTNFEGKPYSYEREFSPAQFRAITIVPFPECCTPRNCAQLIAIWNKSGAPHGYHYEQV